MHSIELPDLQDRTITIFKIVVGVGSTEELQKERGLGTVVAKWVLSWFDLKTLCAKDLNLPKVEGSKIRTSQRSEVQISIRLSYSEKVFYEKKKIDYL